MTRTHSNSMVFAAWLVRIALLVLYVPVQVALLFLRSMSGLDEWASAIVRGEPEKVLTAPRPLAERTVYNAGAMVAPLHEIPSSEIRYHV